MTSNFCHRGNANNIDLNRNWNYKWKKSFVLREENPGKKPFSEVESKFILNSLKNYKAHLFLSIHSGVWGIFFPYAYENLEFANHKRIKPVLLSIKEKFCSVCKLGSPSKLVGYKSPGTSLDYAYEKLKIPISLVWEIYTNEVKLPKMQHINLLHTPDLTDNSKYLIDNCFKLFNPISKPVYDFVVDNWTKVYFY